MSVKIIEIKGSTSILTLYSDYIEGEFFGIAAMGGNFHYKINYNEISSVSIEKVGETYYLIIDYPNKPLVDKLHKLPSNNNFWAKKSNMLKYNKAKDIIEFLRNNPYDENRIKQILNEEFINSNPDNATTESFNKGLVTGMENSEKNDSDLLGLTTSKTTNNNIHSESSQNIQNQPQPNLFKIVFLIIGFIIWGEILEILLKNIFTIFIGQDGFRDQMLKMCGAVWHGRMNYVDWFFRPDFECDSYKFNYIAVHGFLILSATLSYITVNYFSSIILKKKNTYFAWINKSVVAGWIFFDLSFVFLVALIRTYIIGFSPKDNVWMLDGLMITVVHCIALFFIFRNYKFKK